MSLSESQQKAFDAILDGKNIFITGAAGTGKSYLIEQITEYCNQHGKNLSVTATTGVAASKINGMTLHGWAGIGLGDKAAYSYTKDIKKKKDTIKRYVSTDILIIDEISMIDGDYMYKVSEIAKILRNNMDAPFGGIQVVLCGDLYQLGPVSSDKFVFECDIWKEIVQESFVLDKVYRQKEGPFVNLLNDMRVGKVTIETEKLLQRTAMRPRKDSKIKPTKLFCTNADVDRSNTQELAKLPGNEQKFKAKYTFANSEAKRLYSRNFQYPSEISLKIGAQVMLLRNLDVQQGHVNGTRGVVDDIDSLGIHIQLKDDSILLVEKHKQEIKNEKNKVVATIEQYPLRLAYALTINKSQGLSIDSLIVDLSRAFAHGQVYVALSRATDIDNLTVIGFRRDKVRVAKAVRDYYKIEDQKKRGLIEYRKRLNSFNENEQSSCTKKIKVAAIN